MNKILLYSVASAAFLLCSCKSEFNAVYKTNDTSYRYEYAKESYAQQKFSRASILFGDLINITKGTDNGEECLFLYGMSTFNTGDYESAADIFKKYVQTYPKGIFAESASYFVGESLYKGSPEVRLDQSDTYNAIKSYQDFMDLYPFSSMKDRAQSRMYELQDKLVEKELINAKLYYNLGTYFGNCTSGGNNYEACIVTAQNALKDYPYSAYREDFASLIMKSKFELAQQSVEAKKLDRFQDAEDECYDFINEYPDSKERSVAEKYIEKCKKVTKNVTE
jgi:outer membrane protein assembly factor BamD